jgi:hypothetical protein
MTKLALETTGCRTYLEGFVEGFALGSMEGLTPGRKVCIPDQVTYPQLALRDNPKYLHYSRGVVLEQALQTNFPCR